MTDIQEALVRATEGVTSRPDLLDRVRAGGRRRVVRRRSVLAGALAASLGGAYLMRPRDAAAPIDPAIRGDLAGDREFLAKAQAAWRKITDGYETLGPARLRWAGRTPAGGVARFSQPVRVDGGRRFDLAGFVVPDGGTPTVQLNPPDTLVPAALLLGDQRDVLVLDDADRVVELATDYTIETDGRIKRSWAPGHRSPDGVSVQRVPPQRGAVRFGLRPPVEDDPVELSNFAEVIDQRTTTSQGLIRLDRPLPGRELAWPADGLLTGRSLAAWDVTSNRGYDDPYGYHRLDGFTWYLRGATADRRRLVVQTLAMDGDARVFWFLGNTVPRYAGLLSAIGAPVPDPDTGRLPVLRLRLPGQLGVVVAAQNAALRYSTGGGGWLPVTGDAALLPAAADRLEVRPRRGAATTVALP